MKKVLLSFTALSMLFLASCGEDKKDDKKEGEKGDNKKEVVEEKEEIEVLKLSVDLDESHVWCHAWNKNAPEDHTHNGKVRLTEGEIELTNGELTGGYAQISIASLFDSDLKDNEKKEKGLIGHLMSAEFFNIDSTGMGQPRIDVTGYTDGKIQGNLTINGKTSAVEVPADVTVSEKVVAISSDKFELDMTPFGMPYFAQEKEDEKAAILNSSVEFQINLHAHK